MCTGVGFGDEEGVVVRVVAGVEVMVVEGTVHPVVDGLRWAHVQQQAYHQPSEVPHGIRAASKYWYLQGSRQD